MPVRLNMLKASTFCKKNVQNERKVRRNYYLCKQSLQSVFEGFGSIEYPDDIQSRDSMTKIILLFFFSMVGLSLSAQPAERPTMGWSSWNTYRVDISDSLIMQQADAMEALGLKKAGYKYVNIDDGYFGGRDQQTGQLPLFTLHLYDTSACHSGVYR